MHVAVLGATGVAGRAFVPKALGHGHTLQTDRVDIFAWMASKPRFAAATPPSIS